MRDPRFTEDYGFTRFGEKYYYLRDQIMGYVYRWRLRRNGRV